MWIRQRSYNTNTYKYTCRAHTDIPWHFCVAESVVTYRGDSPAQHKKRKLNLTDLCIKHIVEYSVTFITVTDRVCINLNALKRDEYFFFHPLSMCLSMCIWYQYKTASVVFCCFVCVNNLTLWLKYVLIPSFRTQYVYHMLNECLCWIKSLHVKLLGTGERVWGMMKINSNVHPLKRIVLRFVGTACSKM